MNHYKADNRFSMINLLLVATLTISILLVSCNERGPERASSNAWQYPVQLGDSRARVHELLGVANRTTSELEEYSSSGVSVLFDIEGRVVKFNFAGNASAIYSSASSDPIISDRKIIFGLTSHTDEAGFRRILGEPVREKQEGRVSQRELNCIWKKDGYVIDALFLIAERAYKAKTYPKGTLVWFEVSRGL